MKPQALNVFAVILMPPLLMSCCDETTYFLSITDLESRVLVSEGSTTIEYDGQNTIDKEDFIIEVDVISIENIALNEENNIQNDRPEFIYAAVVPCEDQILINTNKIETIKVELIDVDNNNERLDVTSQMQIVGAQQPISEFISETNGNIGGFQIEFSDTTGIPNTIDYEIEATLDDGSTINTRGGVVRFN
ncbi:hypothetical protein [Psychroflexus sediminis]|uniref:Uncharacterized protein n=1 Tax=Psychroflexus sediminis TaxID=470826 RepID=A0A1G7XD10_9FLAO|nr:hypothetical protein [Psychroflexus sediminis]SDG82079.1 hypothetical protein SAMN04488027_10834 [Psychroflexus sediminis]